MLGTTNVLRGSATGSGSIATAGRFTCTNTLVRRSTPTGTPAIARPVPIHGQPIDPKLKWTLEVTISGVSGALNWTHATVATVGGVIQATFPLSQPFSSFAPGSITAKAADYHGLWCKLVMN